MSRVLLVAYSFPPLQDAQALRWAYLAEELSRKGYKIDILTISLPENSGNLPYFSMDFTIHRVFPGFFEYAAYRTRSMTGAGSENDAQVRISRWFRFSRRVYRALRYVLDRVLIGDVRTEWLAFVLPFLGRLELDSYDFLITSQEPFVDSIIGAFIKLKFPGLVWIADFGDTALAPYIPRWRKPIDMAVEKRIMKLADGLVFTNANAAAAIGGLYGIDKRKVVVVPQGYRDFNGIPDSSANGAFTLFFSGTFYPDFRNPEELLKVIERFKYDIKLVVAGRNDAYIDRFRRLGNRVEYLGFMPHFDVLRWQRKADVLVNISNRQLHQIPGKFFEYLGAGKPILNIVYSYDDPTASLTGKLGVGVVCRNVYGSIERAVYRLWELSSEGRLKEWFESRVNRERVSLYRWSVLAGVLDGFMQRIRDEKKHSLRR